MGMGNENQGGVKRGIRAVTTGIHLRNPNYIYVD